MDINTEGEALGKGDVGQIDWQERQHEVNEELDGEPELVNTDPYGRGWMVKISLANPGDEDGLLSAEQYQEFIGA